MLESMIHATVPTRAEVTDVANSVLDGTSAVMLSAETAIGEHPALVIETMARVLHRAEQDFPYLEWGASLGVQQVSGERASALRITAAISGAAWRAAIEEGAAAIIACSASGTTVRSICRFRPGIPIVAVTANEYRARQLRTSWGVSKVLIDDSEDERALANTAMQYLRSEGKVRIGDVVVVLVGSRHTSSPVTDTVRLIRVE
jgi:pyruvate kinase